MLDFSQRLKQLRRDRHLTQAQVAKRIGVTAAMVSSYETDIRLPSYEVMVRLADLFGVTVDYLLCRQDKRFLDISDLSEEEAALVCGMVELLKKKRRKEVEATLLPVSVSFLLPSELLAPLPPLQYRGKTGIMAVRNSRHGRQYEEDETMFRPVRKKANEISVEEAKKLLHEARRGVLAVSGDDGYPYAVPINYLYDEDAQEIIFHGSKVGHKVDALKRSDKVCFTVYGDETVETDEAWAPFLKSAVVFGRCRLVADRGESDALCKKFAMKYYPTEKMVDDEVAASGKAVQMFRISIDHISGKKVQER